MKSKRANILLFLAASIMTAAVYLLIGTVLRSTGIYDFFFSRGLYQPLSLTFFFFGLLLIGNRWVIFREEPANLNLQLPSSGISREGAVELANKISAAHGTSILGRRIADLLRGYARRDEIGPLEERLRAKDRNELDASASLIGWVRSLPPLIGLLGTLDGLRGGIAEISMISNANDLDALRGRLQQFAVHASTAFDTTLLGISAAAILSAVIFLVRKQEDTHLEQVDFVADDLLRRLPHQPEVENQVSHAVDEMMTLITERFHKLMVSATGPLVQEFGSQLSNGMSEAVQQWLAVCAREMSKVSVEILERTEKRNAAGTAAVQATVQEGIGRLAANVEQALARPRPVQIKVVEEGEWERAAHVS